MNQVKPGREVMVVGVGLHPFGRFPDKDLANLALEAVKPALQDAGVAWKDIPVAYFGHVYYHGMSMGETALAELGLTGIPIINVEKRLFQRVHGLLASLLGYRCRAFRLGAGLWGGEGAAGDRWTVTADDSPDRYIGGDHMMAGYALRMRRYMEETGAPAAAFAQVSVKARQNAALNPYAHRKQEHTLEEVLQSRLIADPLTLYQCCPTSEGGAAAVLCAADALDRYGINKGRSLRIAAAVLRSGSYNGRGSDHFGFSAPTAASQQPKTLTK